MGEEHIGWLITLAVGYGLCQLSCINDRLQRTEAKLTALLVDHGVNLDMVLEPSEKVKKLAKEPGSKIAAIKAYREQSGVGLKEAKEVIEGLSHGDKEHDKRQ